MFDIHYFRRDPRPFFKFAKEIYPGQFEPSVSHKFIRMIESQGKLLRNYTQNIDTLEEVCGLQRVINCHGSFSTASCTRCGFRVRADQIKEDIFNQRIPLCPQCPAGDSFQMAVMKPDIVFFGESLSDEFHTAMAIDKDKCDLLLVMGSSLKVRPVALIPSSISPDVPQILSNREPLKHMKFDVELLGDCDVIVQELANRLGDAWTSVCDSKHLLRQISQLELEQTDSQTLSLSQDPSCSNSSAPFLGRQSLADRLPDNSYLFIPPARYVFRGAEVFDSQVPTSEDSDDSSCDWATVSEDCDNSDSSNSSGDSSVPSNGKLESSIDATPISSSDWMHESSDFLFKVSET
jgi:NAD-dependent deacetylase sirtuin 1